MKINLSSILVLIACSLPLSVFAQGAAAPKAWSHESEASVVKVDGNTESESYSAKQKTSYKHDLNTLTGSGRYLQSKASSIETAKQWEASARYEREISNLWAAFVQQGAESDNYAGYVQRDNSDIGGKYFFIKTDKDNFFAELGYRLTKTNYLVGESKTESFGRLYYEYTTQMNDAVFAKLWVEYLPNFSDSDAYLINYEPSINVMMSQIFSLKVAYLTKYHNKTQTAAEEKNDTTFTTALVAKF